jgi:hypothetical protein
MDKRKKKGLIIIGITVLVALAWRYFEVFIPIHEDIANHGNLAWLGLLLEISLPIFFLVGLSMWIFKK